MKILILGDIHSNWPAISAIDEQFDACLFVGDLVDYATDPAPCIEWVRQNATARIRGNHDHAVAQRIKPKGATGLGLLAAETRPIHWELLGKPQIKYLARLPATERLRLDNKTFYLVHATPRDPMDEYLRNDAEGWRTRLKDIDADYVCVGHTHLPFATHVDDITVINPGSVGQPRDGDPRCSYAVLEDGQLHFRRVSYNIDATLKNMRDNGVDEKAVDIAEHMLRSGGMTTGERRLLKQKPD